MRAWRLLRLALSGGSDHNAERVAIARDSLLDAAMLDRMRKIADPQVCGSMGAGRRLAKRSGQSRNSVPWAIDSDNAVAKVLQVTQLDSTAIRSWCKAPIPTYLSQAFAVSASNGGDRLDLLGKTDRRSRTRGLRQPHPIPPRILRGVERLVGCLVEVVFGHRRTSSRRSRTSR